MPSQLTVARHDAVDVLTLSDPATRNSLSEPLLAEGRAALARAAADPAVRAVIVRGDGPQFCAGGNLQGLAARRRAGPDAQRRMLALLHGFIADLQACPKPVIAAVEGAAAGAGFSIALACDLVVAADDARFILSHGRLGLSPDGGATWWLGRGLPRALVHEWMWLAEPVPAARLQQFGLVNRVTDSGQAFDEALRMARQLAQRAPNALASGKALVAAASQHTLAEQLDAERDHFVDNLFHAHGGEGLQAFLDKRNPNFQ